ncbi:MAG: leukotoxin LktA family filamentous adhesin, partial [Endomicrobium sp.]|nr:leukotoxin LktA family filamentous adhesin [Endomicrobium sp.]
MKKKIIAVAAGLAFVFAQTGLAQVVTNITPDTSKTATTVVQTGNSWDVNTDTVKNKTGFNAFTNFDLGYGDTANLHLPTEADNLVNIVTGSNKSFIDGTLNSYRNGKIGGNVFFLNPNGIAIGATGIVNVGALTLAAPSKKYIDDVFERFGESDFQTDNFIKAIFQGDIPINANGNISVKGKINAYYGINIHGAAVDISGNDAQLNTLKAINAADIVNLDDVPSVEIKNIGGKILITAKDINIDDGAVIKSVKDDSNGFQKAGDIDIRAYDTGVKNDDLRYLNIADEKAGMDEKEGGAFIAKREAIVNIGKADISGNDISITAKASNNYDYKKLKDFGGFKDIFSSEVNSLIDHPEDIVKNPSAFFENISNLRLTDSDWWRTGTLFNDIPLDINTLFSVIGLIGGVGGIVGDIISMIDAGLASSSVQAEVNIGSLAVIKADNNLNIKSEVVSTTAMKAESKGLSLALGINNSASKINIGDTALFAGNDVNITAKSTINSSIEAIADSETKNKEEDDSQSPMAITIAAGLINSDTSVKTEAEIKAGNNIAIANDINKNMSIKTESKVADDSVFGAALLLNASQSNNSIDVSGRLESGANINIESKLTENKNKVEASAAKKNASSKADAFAIASIYFQSNDASNVVVDGAEIINGKDLTINSLMTFAAAEQSSNANGISFVYGNSIFDNNLILDNLDINSEGNVNINADTSIKNITKAAGKPLLMSGINGNAVAAVSSIDAKTSVSLSDSVKIESKKDVSITGKTTKDSSVIANSISANPASIGVAGSYSTSNIESDVTLNGTNIVADNINVNSIVDNTRDKTEVTVVNGQETDEPKYPKLDDYIKEYSKEAKPYVSNFLDGWLNSNAFGINLDGWVIEEPKDGKEAVTAGDKLREGLVGLAIDGAVNWVKGPILEKRIGVKYDEVKKYFDKGSQYYEKISAFLKNFKNDGGENTGNGNNEDDGIAIGAAVSILEHSNNASVNILSSSELSAEKDINISAKTIQKAIENDVAVEIEGNTEFSGIGAVLSANYKEDASVLVDNSSLDAGNNINIKSEQNIPVKDKLGTWLDDVKTIKGNNAFIPFIDATDLIAPTVEGVVKRQIDEAISDLGDDFFNNWIRVVSVGDDNGEGISIAGGVNLSDFDLTAKTTVNNSKINQKSNKTGNQNINISANSDNALV